MENSAEEVTVFKIFIICLFTSLGDRPCILHGSKVQKVHNESPLLVSVLLLPRTLPHRQPLHLDLGASFQKHFMPTEASTCVFDFAPFYTHCSVSCFSL